MTDPFENLSADILEERYRADPGAFKDWVEAHPHWTHSPMHAAWQARMVADGLFEHTVRSRHKAHFGYPVITASLIALPFLLPYWQTGEFSAEWSQPWLGLFAFLPLMLWHAAQAAEENVLRVRIAVGVAIGIGITMVLMHKGLGAWPGPARILTAMATLDTADAERVMLLMQTHDLMLLHGPLLLLGITGAVWSWSHQGGHRVDFIRNGLQVVIYTALIAAAGGLFTGLSLLMAQMVGLDPERIGIHLLCWGGSGALVFAHHVWLRQPDALKPILPVIAGLFVPLFVLLEGGFLVTFLSKGLTELTQDREELLIFNVLLGAVIGLVLLHSALQRNSTRLGNALVAILVALGVFADLIGILAIGNRLLEMGLTPNRLAVLATNILFLLTLLALIPSFLGRFRARGWPDVSGVLNRALVSFVVWTAIVTLGFPAHQLWATRDLDPDAFEAKVEQVEVENQAEEENGTDAK